MINMDYTYQSNLPIFEKKDEILHSIKSNQVTIITGETGSGKTTQLPLMCVEAGFSETGLIGCTQPRRIAAVSLASHTATFFNDPKTVGYKIRFREQMFPESKIKFMTDGILLSEISSDPLLRKYQVIIVDEAHERSVNIDFLLGYMRTLLPKRPDLRLIISSATIDARLFSRCFNHAPVITVGGRLFPVEIRYKPVIELWKGQSMDCYIEGAIDSIREILQSKNDGDILVFLPTIDDVLELVNRLTYIYSEDIIIYPLHSRMSYDLQKQIFKPVGKRKIVVSTNIAETSITVPGIRYVIDSGLARMLIYEPAVGFNRMPISAISKASAQQRAGRCGRVSDGICIRLYSENDLLSRPAYTMPEIRRTNLAGVILKMLSLGLGDASKFPFPQSLSPKALHDGYGQLQELGATDRRNRLTNLGKRMARLPLDPPVSSMIMYARDHGVLTEVLIIAAALSVDEPWNYHGERPSCFRHKESDFMSYIGLWTAFHGSLKRSRYSRATLKKFCEKYNLLPLIVREWFEAHKQLEMICRPVAGNRFEEHRLASYDSIHKSLMAGLIHGIACRVDKGLYHGVHTGEIHAFPASVLFSKDTPWVLFHQVVETSKIYGRMAAVIKPGWIEELFRNKCRYSWHDPWFDQQYGTVRASEEVTIYGLELVKNRYVDLDKKDPGLAHDVFIREALVKELVGDRFRFIRVNRELRDYISICERKARTGLYKGDLTLEALYEDKLPEITSVRQLVNKIKEMNGDSFLIFRKDDLMDECTGMIAGYPDSIEVIGQKLNVSYLFEPGRENDGATIFVPSNLFKITPLYYWEWMLPVFVKKRIQICIDSISARLNEKSIDRETAVKKIEDQLWVCSGPFLERLSAAIIDISGIAIDPDELDSFIPDYLWSYVVVHDSRNIVLRAFRANLDIQSNENSIKGVRAPEWGCFCEQIEVQFNNQWEEVNFLKPVPVGSFKQALPLAGYPALHFEQDCYWVRVFFSLSEANKSHSECIRQMAEHKIAESLAWELETFKLPEQLCSKLKKAFAVESPDDLAERLYLNLIFKQSADIPCNSNSFTTYAHDASIRVGSAKVEAITLIEKIISGIDTCRNLFKKRSDRHGMITSESICEELRKSIDDYQDIFISDSAPVDLVELLPECLSLMVRRIDMGFLEPRKYKEVLEPVRQFSDQLESLFSKKKWVSEADHWKKKYLLEKAMKCQLTRDRRKIDFTRFATGMRVNSTAELTCRIMQE